MRRMRTKCWQIQSLSIVHSHVSLRNYFIKKLISFLVNSGLSGKLCKYLCSYRRDMILNTAVISSDRKSFRVVIYYPLQSLRDLNLSLLWAAICRVQNLKKDWNHQQFTCTHTDLFQNLILHVEWSEGKSVLRNQPMKFIHWSHRWRAKAGTAMCHI